MPIENATEMCRSIRVPLVDRQLQESIHEESQDPLLDFYEWLALVILYNEIIYVQEHSEILRVVPTLDPRIVVVFLA